MTDSAGQCEGTPSPWLSVVIPIKDERDNLRPLIEQLREALKGLPEPSPAPFEILLVDDGSTDGSADLMDELAREYEEVQALHLDGNYGQSAAFDAGFRHASGLLVVTLDGDLQYDPMDIAALLPFTKTHDLVCGRRAARHDSFLRRISSRVAFLIRNAVIGDGVQDTGCSLKIFRRSLLQHIPPFRGMHRFYPALAKMYGFSVAEVPVRHFPRLHGRSKYGVGNRLFAGLYDLVAVRWMQRRLVRYRVKRKDGSP